MFIKADTKEEAYKKFDSNFGYEDVDIWSCEQVTEQEVLKATIKGYENWYKPYVPLSIYAYYE